MTTTNDNTVPTTGRSAAGPWSALLLAGAFEVGYALSVNGSQGFTHLAWSLVALVFFLCKDVLQQSTIVDVFNHITSSIWSLSWNTVWSDWVNALCV